MNAMYFGKNFHATNDGTAFGNSIAEPVKMTMRVYEQDECTKVVCFYDIRTQEVWIEGECKNADALCSLVKKDFDDVFSDRHEFETLLLEALCRTEGIRLGRYFTPNYSFCYRHGLYDLAVPVSACGSMDADKFDEYLRRTNSSELSMRYALALYFILMRDPSYLNQEFMIRRERGKRNGTKVTREFQRRTAIVLEKAEKLAREMNSLRESM